MARSTLARGNRPARVTQPPFPSSPPSTKQAGRAPGRVEFIVLAAMLMSLIALSVDVMLPAFDQMSEHFALRNDNDRQAIITIIFVGLMLGQLLFGPLSDYIGRKPAILIGVGLHATGTLICITASDFTMLLLGRFLQGFGGAGPRIVIVAMVRDRFSGQQMGQVISIVLSVFILVPTFAPALGQIILLIAPWRALFALLLAVALLGGSWLALRQGETHTNRPAFNAAALQEAVKTVITTPLCMLYALAAGCAFGTLLSYIVSSQQILQDLYGTGTLFALYFGITAGCLALSTSVNAWLLNHYTMEVVTGLAIGVQGLWSLAFLSWTLISGQTPSLTAWMIFISVALFLVGMTFGNYNAIALRPLGAVAGIASSITASIQTLVSLSVATITGAAFAMNVTPVIVTSVVMSLTASALMLIARRHASRLASKQI